MAKKEHCVFTAPPGQLPAKLLKCFKTKKAAKRFAHRQRYLQVISRNLGGRRK